MARKIIRKTRFTWQEDEQFRLNYQMLFDDKKPEETAPDYQEVLQQKQQEWAAELKSARQQAYEKGVQEGFQQGCQKGRSELEQSQEVFKKEFMKARQEWKEVQDLLKPGLLQLVFDLCEAILGIPVVNGAMRNKLEEELRGLFQEIDKKSRPVLWVSAEDYDMVDALQKEFAETTGVVIRVSKYCKPGEYQLETNREKIVREFRLVLEDFKESLILPK